ncbi:MAG: tRNA (adenosine(37)-N6)-threonylcarbamoyltransferase complex ATPase subunit type 1 TsaE [Pirellulales bacterium]
MPMHPDFDDLPEWEFTFRADDESDTDRLGAALAACLPDGAVVSLCGTLGAGKTRLVQAVAAACEVPRDQVVSPTFVLCHEYHGQRTLYHLDAYRLADSDEFLALGPEEFFAGPALTFIEWGDRVEDALPPEHWRIDILVTSDHGRRFDFRCRSKRDSAAFERLQAMLS